LLIEEKQCAERLVLRRSGDMSVYCKMREKGADFLLTHFVGMAFAMKKNEAPDPVDLSVFGADAVALYAQVAAYSIE